MEKQQNQKEAKKKGEYIVQCRVVQWIRSTIFLLNILCSIELCTSNSVVLEAHVALGLPAPSGFGALTLSRRENSNTTMGSLGLGSGRTVTDRILELMIAGALGRWHSGHMTTLLTWFSLERHTEDESHSCAYVCVCVCVCSVCVCV